MSYFTQAEHVALIANPSEIGSLYSRHRARFLADLGSGFDTEIEELIQFGFCGLVAFDLKPYGQSIKTELTDLLAAQVLDCDNYAILTWRLFDILCPRQKSEVCAVGWNGGPIGNHAQMLCEGQDDSGKANSIMVDPTVGVFVGGADFDTIARGIPIEPKYLCSLYAACGRLNTVTDQLHDNVRRALLDGQYRPSQLLYYYVDLDRYIDPVKDFHDWMTPQAQALVK